MCLLTVALLYRMLTQSRPPAPNMPAPRQRTYSLEPLYRAYGDSSMSRHIQRQPDHRMQPNFRPSGHRCHVSPKPWRRFPDNFLCPFDSVFHSLRVCLPHPVSHSNQLDHSYPLSHNSSLSLAEHHRPVVHSLIMYHARSIHHIPCITNPSPYFNPHFIS
jgi:hypothetical protein